MLKAYKGAYMNQCSKRVVREAQMQVMNRQINLLKRFRKILCHILCCDWFGCDLRRRFVVPEEYKEKFRELEVEFVRTCAWITNEYGE